MTFQKTGVTISTIVLVLLAGLILIINSKISKEVQEIETKPEIPRVSVPVVASHQRTTQHLQTVSPPAPETAVANTVSRKSGAPKSSNESKDKIIYQIPLEDPILIQ